MATPRSVTLVLTAGSAAYYVASATPTSGQSMTMAHTATPDVARRVLATVGSEASGRTIAITGTDRYGNAITETLTIAASTAGTVGSTQDFATLTSVVTGGGAWTAAMTVGTSATGSSPWLPVNAIAIQGGGVITWNCILTGTATFALEGTLDDYDPAVYGASNNAAYPPVPNTMAIATAQSASAFGSIAYPIRALRLTNSSGTGSVKVEVWQSTQ